MRFAIASAVWTVTEKNREIQIDYPDGGYEMFGYDASHFYQLSSHRMFEAVQRSTNLKSEHANNLVQILVQNMLVAC
jgi:hypothetical protein